MTTIKPLSPKEPKPDIVNIRKITFSDGLNFGCGFWVAGFLFTIVAIPVAAFLLSIVIGLLGGAAGLGR